MKETERKAQLKIWETNWTVGFYEGLDKFAMLMLEIVSDQIIDIDQNYLVIQWQQIYYRQFYWTWLSGFGSWKKKGLEGLVLFWEKQNYAWQMAYLSTNIQFY